MAEAQLNELFEEAIGRCEELSDQADGAADSVEEMVDGAEELADRFASEAEETRRALQQLTTGLEHAEGTLAAAVDGAKSGLDGLVTHSAEVQSAVTDGLGRVKDGLGELDALREELRGRLEQRGQDAAADVEALGQKVAALQEALATRLEEASEAIQELSDAVTSAQEDWAGKRDALMEAIDGLEKDSRQATGKYAAEIADILDNQRVDVLVRTLANEMLIGSHNDAIEEVGQRIEEQIPDGLPDRLQPLAAAVAELKELCGQHKGALQQKAAEVRARVDKAAQSLERIAPALDSAQQVG